MLKTIFEKDWTINDASLIWVEAIFVGDTKYRKKLLGHEFGGHFFLSHNQSTSFYLNKNTENKIKQIAKEKYLNIKFLENFLALCQKIDRENLDQMKHFTPQKLRILNNQELFRIFSIFFNSYAKLASVYRFMRPETYRAAIDFVKFQLPKPKAINLTYFLDNDFNKIQPALGQKLKKLGILLKKIGQARLKMHQTYVETFSRAEGLFKEIGKRLNLTSLEVKNLTFEEIKNYLINNLKPDKGSIDKRIKYFKFIYLKKDFQVDIATKEITKAQISETHEFKGLPAFPGQARGKVRLISYRLGRHLKDELRAFQEGEILVAITTSPDYIGAIRKASAIITDEGGMLSHAAIISRELKIPCIVGTRFATEILKDGDLAEVDANKGVVRIIKK